MATTNQMIQLYTEQIFDPSVKDVPGLEDDAYLLLNPKRNTVIREITSEEEGGVLASESAGLVPIGLTDKAFTEVRLIYLDPKKERPEIFYAPSHVNSPAIGGVVLAILRVMEAGYSVTSGNGKLSVFRAIGAHAYIDQID